MTAPLRGDDLAYATLDYTREHQGEWDQRYYFCGSTACFAGRAILLGLPRRRFSDVFASRSPGRQALELLGWTENQALYVFSYQTTDFTALEQRVKDVLNGDVR